MQFWPLSVHLWIPALILWAAFNVTGIWRLNRVEQRCRTWSKSKPFLVLQRGGLERDDDTVGDSIKMVPMPESSSQQLSHAIAQVLDVRVRIAGLHCTSCPQAYGMQNRDAN